MLYFIYGKDFKARRKKKNELLAVLRKKRPGSEVFTLEAEGFEEQFLDELLFGQGLFETKHITWGSGLFTNDETKAFFEKRLQELSESPNVFLFLEEKVTGAQLKKIEKSAEKIFSVGDGEKEKKESFNNFLLADALGKRDKKNLWVLYQKSVRTGGVPEEIHGILFWQMKTILLAQNSRTAEEAGLKSYPFKKAKQFSKNYSLGEAENITRGLVGLYHEAHRSGDFYEKLERYILAM